MENLYFGLVNGVTHILTSRFEPLCGVETFNMQLLGPVLSFRGALIFSNCEECKVHLTTPREGVDHEF